MVICQNPSMRAHSCKKWIVSCQAARSFCLSEFTNLYKDNVQTFVSSESNVLLGVAASRATFEYARKRSAATVNVQCGVLPQPPVVIRQDLRLPGRKVWSSRLTSVDLLRGLVMALMSLDHTRLFFNGLPFPPEDLAHTSGPLFFTRFVTYFCAPVFFLLAGTGGYLSLSQGRSVAQVSRFFWTRGFWLVFLDFTIIPYAWTCIWPVWFSGVLWSLGWSGVAMPLMIRLPVPWLAGLGAGIVVTHNLLDGVHPSAFGRFAGVWLILHGHGWFWLEPGKI